MEFVDNEPSNIWIAASDGDIDRVKQLISEGVSVNAQDETGYSPMHAASSYGHVDLVKYLLSVGADVKLRDEDGDTPLLVCEIPEVFEVLKAAGADPNAVNRNKEGLIQKAVEDENEDLIKYLFENNLINDPTFKYTPGMFELQLNHEEFEGIEEGDEGEEEEEDAEDAKMES